MALQLSPSLPVWTSHQLPGALIFLAAYSVIWTVFAVLSDPGGLHHDMTEAYAWGREFQLGYYKHPPFWAWIAGLWFEIFPRENWAFYLLAALNTGAAVLGVWYLSGLFTAGFFRIASTALILLIPFYTLQGHKFNANLILVALWPWTAYFFVRSMDKLKLRDAILFGVFAAAGLLSKYYSALLLLSCVIASFLHPNRKAYYLSALPYFSVGVCAVLVAPHVWWLTQHDFQTLTYIETRTAFSAETVSEKRFAFIFGSLAFCSLAFLVVLGARLWGGRWSIGLADEPIQRDRARFAMALAFGPFILTVLSSIVGHIRLSTNFASPLFFLAPLVMIQALKPKPGLVMRASVATAVGLTVAALIISPLVPSFASVSRQRRDELPMPEIARQARSIWMEETGKPLRIVAANEIYSVGIAFYSQDNTSAFIAFDMSRSPWIKATALRQNGFLSVCLESDSECSARAREIAGNPVRERMLRVPRDNLDGGPSQLVFRLLIAAPTEPVPPRGVIPKPAALFAPARSLKPHLNRPAPLNSNAVL